jgi:uncharacterized membrane protein YbhN (UPF0104 family)
VVASVGFARFGGRAMVNGFACYLAYMVLSGLLFVGTLVLQGSEAPISMPWSTLAGAYVAAWLAGLVTPGAPAGLGVREMLILVLLAGKVPDGALLVAVLLTRILSILADVLCFLAAFILRQRSADVAA